MTRKGVVEQVGAGQASGCEDQAPSAEEEGAAAASEVSETRRPSALKPPVRPMIEETGLPSLAVQNSLFARALAAERQGNLTEAEHQLSQLLERFPETPLLADAEAARTRIRKRRAELSP